MIKDYSQFVFMVSPLYLDFFRVVAETAICDPISTLSFYFSNRVLILFVVCMPYKRLRFLGSLAAKHSHVTKFWQMKYNMSVCGTSVVPYVSDLTL